MWIRSKDKKGLYNVKRFEIFSKDSKWRIVSWTSSAEYEDFDILGEYDTEARCIEILDGVQRFIDNYNCKYNIQISSTYEMPSE